MPDGPAPIAYTGRKYRSKEHSMSSGNVGGAVRGQQFASDNCAGICQEAWNSLREVNTGCVASCGNDPLTAKACLCVLRGSSNSIAKFSFASMARLPTRWPWLTSVSRFIA